MIEKPVLTCAVVKVKEMGCAMFGRCQHVARLPGKFPGIGLPYNPSVFKPLPFQDDKTSYAEPRPLFCCCSGERQLCPKGVQLGDRLTDGRDNWAGSCCLGLLFGSSRVYKKCVKSVCFFGLSGKRYYWRMLNC